MLKKLLKHEWNSVSKVLGPVNLGVILITLIGSIILSTDLLDGNNMFHMIVLLLSLYIISLMTFASVTLIYVYVRFYKNLFTAEGYLMYTLPVTGTQLFHSKLLVGFFWSGVNTMLTMLSTIILAFTATLHTAREEDIQYIFSSANDSVKDFRFEDILGYQPVVFFMIIILVILTSCLSSILMVYLSILLGQLVEKNRLAASIGFYMVIYLINQIFSSIVMIFPNTNFILEGNSVSFIGDLFRLLFPGLLITQLFFSIVFYVVSLILVRRQVNLE